jgi:hypothetical protein
MLGAPMPWHLSHRFDSRALPLADRHYNRRKPGTPQFAAPGRTLALLTEAADALWVSTWPYAHLAWHEWAGAWVNTLFRNEGAALASDLIRAAVAATRWRWGEPPAVAFPFVTFINAEKVRPKRDPGYCYLMAGWERIGTTAGGLLVFGLARAQVEAPQAPFGAQLELVPA